MFKYLIVLAVLCQMQNTIAQSDTLPLPLPGSKTNCSQISGENKKPVINMTGYNNYHIDQQVFYLFNGQQLKQLLLNNNNTKKGIKDDYIITPGMGRHKLHLDAVTWNVARRACIQEGGHLAVINSISEEKLLLHMMEEKNISTAWLGLHDLYQEGDWVTILDEPIENTGYTRWSTKWFPVVNPNNAGGNQNCATLIFPEEGMDDVYCGHSVPFFCEQECKIVQH
ncbi:hemolymph lipopolysaccharide-binding protein-like [Ooceraea biroi]|uniref:hemolymph lipopolysaccharide-binding protein-like n=1 Tax=Ooceraea biroi TaxID=2015173 RepID=UPI0005BB81AF|nr:hemolymph lipopolysaccharide-binding protein-like [Ooceraea biroi]